MNSITVNIWSEIPNNYTGYVKFNCGKQAWLKNGKVHRDDGPAIIHNNGTQSWYKNGKQHREDGPARIWSDGRQHWWLNDIIYSKEDYYKELYKRGLITEQELFLELL